MDERIKKLASLIVNHSLEVQKGYLIEISCGAEAKDLVNELARLILLKGAYPRIQCSIPGFAHTYYKNASEEQLKSIPSLAIYDAQHIDGFITISTDSNTKELSSIDPAKIARRRKATKQIGDIVVKKDNWVLFKYPTEALAQDAEMSLAEFEDFVYDSCLVDWDKVEREEEKLKKALDAGKEVRIVGKDTDLRFSIAGRTAIKCFGERNLPDGEVYIAPVETSTEGYISYDYPVIAYGKEVDGIRLRFSKGKVIEATAAKNQDLLRKMIALDPGASRLGEFGIGTNFNIKKFIKQILFDEKIGGTVHLALGMAYPKGGGKNKSALHWDMIKDLRKGGAVYIDGTCLLKDGKFLI